jgi:predicted tellurium resistance membrane protein TerC
LLLIGVSLIAEGMGFHIPKGYIYSGIGVAILIEAFNQFSQRNVEKISPRFHYVIELPMPFSK